MRICFPCPDLALGFKEGIGDPDGLDLVATQDGCIVEIDGIDASSEFGSDLLQAASNIRGVLVPETMQ